SSKVIISDSGGIQEEAPTFGVPVLILRKTTERPEAVNLGYSKLVGMNKHEIINAFNNFNPTFENTKNPYGDGRSSKRIIETLICFNHTMRVNLITILFSLLYFFYCYILKDYIFYSSFGLSFTLYIFIDFVSKLGKTFPIKEFIVLIAALQWIVGAKISYSFGK